MKKKMVDHMLNLSTIAEYHLTPLNYRTIWTTLFLTWFFFSLVPLVVWYVGNKRSRDSNESKIDMSANWQRILDHTPGAPYKQNGCPEAVGLLVSIPFLNTGQIQAPSLLSSNKSWQAS